MRNFTRRRERGYFLIFALMALTFITLMLTVAYRDNIIRRRALGHQRRSLEAFYLAESGAQEAMQRIAERADAAEFEIAAPSGRATVHTAPVAGQSGEQLEITAMGSAPAIGKVLTRGVTIRVHAPRASQQVRADYWQDR